MERTVMKKKISPWLGVAFWWILVAVLFGMLLGRSIGI